MITKVVFFRYLPLTHKVYSDFYMREIQNAGFCVEYWYLPFIISVPTGVENYENECVRVILSYKDLEKRIKREDREKTLFISIQTYNGAVLRLFWIMTKNRCKLSVFGRNMIPMAPIEYKQRKYNVSEIILVLYNKLSYYLKKLGIIKSYDVLFLSAETGINAYGFNTTKERYKSKHIYINGNDYDKALEVQYGDPMLKEEFIVFIDTCLPLHPDIGICNIKPMDADTYYNQLNEFFDKVEFETGKKIIIAAHPKSLIYNEKDFFCGRKVIFGKTAELIRDSSLVLFHNSTSVGFAVFFNKPVVCLVSNAMRDGQRETYDSSLHFAHELNTQLIYIDDYCYNNGKNLLNCTTIDKEAYSKYKYKYMTNYGTENSSSLELVLEGLKSL